LKHVKNNEVRNCSSFL